MELEELKGAWQALGRQLERQEKIQWQLLRERKLDGVRRSLRALSRGQVLQALLGVGLVVLGVACWKRNLDVPGLFVSGILVHAFGVAHAALAGITLGLVGTIDYAAPVVRIQKQLSRLDCFYALNSSICGAPWMVMWLPVTLAVAGLSRVEPAAGTPPWILASLLASVVGLVAIYAWSWRVRRRRRAGAAGGQAFDESGAIRRGRALLEELAEFERD